MTSVELSTLQIRRPVINLIGYTVLFLLVIFFFSEGFLRLSFVHGRLETSRMGSRHSQLGEKLRLMKAVIDNEGKLDCVLLGSSVVDNGFDPPAFSQMFQDTTGKPITCFNFGIDALPTATAGRLAEIIVQDFHPEILIYGADPRDFAVPRDADDTTVLLDSPWIRYRSGRFNLEGWLFEHSYLKRYAPQLEQLLALNFNDAFWKPKLWSTPLGYNGLSEVDFNVKFPPKTGDDSFQVVYLSNLLGSFEVPQENLDGLNQILNLNSDKVQVFVVMMPVADGYYSFYGNGRSDYDSFIRKLDDMVSQENVPFIQPFPASQIPEDGWFDYMHVNATGANVFSRWLGHEIGVMISGNNIE